MYLASLLNNFHLFQRLASIDMHENRTFMMVKKEILSRGTSAALSLSRIGELNKNCIQEYNLFEDQLNIKNDRIIFSSESLGYLLNEIPTLLSTLIVMQNLQMRFLRCLTGKELPKSLSDYFKNPEKYNLDSSILSTQKRHWNSTGKLLREYRDIDQHFTILTEHYFINISENKKIEVLFPDNPEIKSIGKFTFKNNIDGIEFMNKAFNEIHQAFEEISAMYSDEDAVIPDQICMDQLGELYPPMERTLSFMFEKNVIKEQNTVHLNFKGLEISQDSKGHLTFRECILSKDKIESLKRKT